MTEKEIRKLNRYQLLELLIVQLERADRLQARLDSLENKTGGKDRNTVIPVRFLSRRSIRIRRT